MLGQPPPVGLNGRTVDGQAQRTVHRAAVTALICRVEVRLRLLPIRPVELLNHQSHRLIEAVRIDAPRIRVRAGLIEALHAATAAEQVLGSTCAEPIAGQRITARKKLELLVWDNHVQKARGAANRTVAIERWNGRVRQLGVEPNGSTMTSTSDSHERGLRTGHFSRKEWIGVQSST
jgi:hypothetical protein